MPRFHLKWTLCDYLVSDFPFEYLVIVHVYRLRSTCNCLHYTRSSRLPSENQESIVRMPHGDHKENVQYQCSCRTFSARFLSRLHCIHTVPAWCPHGFNRINDDGFESVYFQNNSSDYELPSYAERCIIKQAKR